MEEKRRLDALFEQALTTHRAGMYRAAMAMLRCPADAEDAVSQATVKVYARLHRIRDWQAIRPYLMRATANACRDELRRRARVMPAEDALLGAAEPVEDEGPLWPYLDKLKPETRLILTLRYGEGWPLKDICRALKLSKGTASSRISRGLNQLRAMMEDEHAP